VSLRYNSFIMAKFDFDMDDLALSIWSNVYR
jgi:hypothetical protein